ncbi:hypothetical protein ACN079_11905 [Pseudomonas sp. ABY48]|uniref:hypothetical protein n=1 Tax=Pseudomonas sp. ABY48 TaxID=3402865 RepID=UPI003B4353A0
MVTDLELNDLGCSRILEIPTQFREKPTHGRTPMLQAKDHSAVFLARWMILSNGWLNDDGKLIQHQKDSSPNTVGLKVEQTK